MKIHRFAFASLASALLVGGCTSIQPRRDLPEVSRAVQDRTGAEMTWYQSTERDPNIAAATRLILKHELTESSAVQIALFNNRDLQASIEELGIGQAELVQAGLLSNPVLNTMVRFPDGAKSGSDVEVSVSQNFIELLSLPMRKRIAAEHYEATKARVSGDVFALATSVREAFYELSAADETLAMRTELQAVANAGAAAIGELRRAGNVTELKCLSRSAANAQAQLDLSLAEVEATKAREKLCLLLQLSDDDWHSIQMPAQLPKSDASDNDERNLESLAIHQRLDLAAMLSEANALGESVGLIEKFSWLNDTQLAVSSEHDVEGFWVTGPGISLPIPIFDTGAAKRAVARGELRQAANRLQGMNAKIRSEVRIANSQLSAAKWRAKYLDEKLVPLRRSILQETQSHYNAMSASVFDLLDSKHDELLSQIDAVNARRDYWLARIGLERAIGGRLPSAIHSATNPSEANQ